MNDQPITTNVALEEDCIPIRVVEVVEYLDPEGNVKWVGRHVGCDTWSILFGVMEAGKFYFWSLDNGE